MLTRGNPNSYNPNPDRATNGTADMGLMNLPVNKQKFWDIAKKATKDANKDHEHELNEPRNVSP